MQGWLPLGVEAVTVVALAYAVGRRSRRWRWTWLPVAVAVGALGTLAVFWWLRDSGAAGEPAPWSLWAWTTVTGIALCVAVFGWRGTGWWRRNVAVFAASFAFLSTGLVINGWIGYYPTAAAAWGHLASRPLPGETTLAAATAMRAAGERPTTGRVVGIHTGDAASGFRHREEWVYLPPAWFRGAELPTVMMIGGEFTTPTDWIRSGDAVSTADAYAASHDGRAPILVLVDPSGSFATDTECVNGVRGRAADHLVLDVMPHVTSTFGTRARWGVVGFSSGGTCALDLAVMHPDRFSAFVSIGGDERPNTGTDAQTIDRLFGGDRDAWTAFDPATVIARHGRYTDLAGTFVVPTGSRADDATARRMCALAESQAISCTVIERPGRHDWPFAAAAFSTTLPWLMATSR